MQQPTCTDLRIRSTTDAHKIFAAVKQGLLQMVSRRLDADERLALRSGCIYAWEERGPHTETSGLGIERFTEGRRWSPSRVRDEFLFYYEKYSPPPNLNNPGAKSVEVKPPRDWDPLVKQTYSVWVETEKGRRKWHLTAYFTQATIDQLSTVDDIPRMRELAVPEGMFKSTRLARNRFRPDGNKGSDTSKAVTPRSFSAIPSPYNNNQYQSQIQKGTPSVQPVFMHEPYQTTQSPEPQSPGYESSQSPPPISSQDPRFYHQAQVTYSNENGSQPFPSTAYHRPSIALPNPIASFSHAKPNNISPPEQDVNLYYPSSESPSSWSNEDGLDYNDSPPPHRMVHPSSPLTPPTYSLANQAESAPFDYTYQAPMQNHSTQLYSTPYSLNSGYTSTIQPPQAHNLPNLGERGVHLPSLSIPERSNGFHYAQDTSSISPAESPTLHPPEGYTRTTVSALAPLNVIRRPAYPRDPLDEMTLRMLQAPQANP